MASAYKRTSRRPVPATAEITEAVKRIPKTASVDDGIATWPDRDGCLRTAEVRGSEMVTLTAKWGSGSRTSKAPVDHTGQWLLVAGPNYTVAYIDATGRRVQRSTGTTDKATAVRMGTKWEDDASLQRQGIIDPAHEQLAESAAKPILDHLNAYLAHLATKGGTEDHRERIRQHLTEFATSSKWRSLRDIKAEDVTEDVATLKAGGSSPRTIQARLQSIKGFTKWLTEEAKMPRNPLLKISKPNPETDRRHERRMLQPAEWPWLAKTLASSQRDHNGLKPAERLLLYRLAIQTGLRAGELETLTSGSFKLDGKPAYVLCKAAGTQNNKMAQQFIEDDLTADLRAYIKRRGRRVAVFPMVSRMSYRER